LEEQKKEFHLCEQYLLYPKKISGSGLQKGGRDLITQRESWKKKNKRSGKWKDALLGVLISIPTAPQDHKRGGEI